MTFSRDAFAQRLKEIEVRLGYLRGNENAYRFLDDLRTSMSDPPDRGGEPVHMHIVKLDPGYRFPCPDAAYSVTPEWGGWGLPTWASPSHPITDAVETSLRRQVQEAADDSFRNGEAWASGIATYAQELCDQFTKPDVPTLVTTVLDVQRRVVAPLQETWNDDWARLGGLETEWTSEAGRSFQEFYQNCNEHISREGWYAASTNIGFALAAKLISGTQVGAMDYLDQVKEACDAQLARWVQWGSQPHESSGTDIGWIADVFAIGQDVVSVAAAFFEDELKTVKRVVGVIGNVRDIVTGVEDLTASDSATKQVTIPGQTAEELYTSFTATLRGDFLGDYQQALRSLQTGRAPDGVPDAGDLETAAFSGSGLEDVRAGDPNDDLTGVPPENLVGEHDSYT